MNYICNLDSICASPTISHQSATCLRQKIKPAKAGFVYHVAATDATSRSQSPCNAFARFSGCVPPPAPMPYRAATAFATHLLGYPKFTSSPAFALLAASAVTGHQAILPSATAASTIAAVPGPFQLVSVSRSVYRIHSRVQLGGPALLMPFTS